MPGKTVATVNATGRQAASFARVASAVGWHVKAHVADGDHPVAQELEDLEHVEVIEGSLEDSDFVTGFFSGIKLAFINTLSWGDEVAIGKALADAAKKAGVQHYIYSSMPDHSVSGKGWPALPHWSVKFTVENYIRQVRHLHFLVAESWNARLTVLQINLPSTFVYAGIYNNNFTSQPFPLFCMKLLPDGSFLWKAPFHPDEPIPFLDAEHDVGPTILQILKDGHRRWAGQRIGLAFELLTPQRVCQLFSRALGRKAKYEFSPSIEIEVPIPAGYKEQLQGIELLFGKFNAPYFGELLDGERGGKIVEGPQEGRGSVVEEARELWAGWRGIEEYAREVFPVEEANNGLTWMQEHNGNEA